MDGVELKEGNPIMGFRGQTVFVCFQRFYVFMKCFEVIFKCISVLENIFGVFLAQRGPIESSHNDKSSPSASQIGAEMLVCPQIFENH